VTQIATDTRFDADSSPPRTLRPVMRERSTKKIYDKQSKVYDLTFGKLVTKRVEKAIQQFDIKTGDLVLDLGVGTGNSLEHYPDVGTIVGIDLSFGMLDKAQGKLDDDGKANVGLVQGNALHLPFGEDSFDHVFISHVISVVSDPVAVLREMQRVTKPGARVVMLNHFQSSNKMVAKIEKMVSPICTKLGWRSDLALRDLMLHTGIEIDYRYKVTTPDLWETVVFTNKK
jgi:phosphatidylethanolamine/phosphatidyl-N-methylethanolamine N-methyltransferase